METKKINVGVLGYGEVGKAMASFYESRPEEYLLQIQDKATGMIFMEGVALDILNVCIPYSDNFINTVLATIEEFAPEALVIIHSTVPCGTTEVIQSAHEKTVHSPVRGVHPKLAEGIAVFTKYIGADSAGAGRIAGEHLLAIGIENMVVRKSRTTELLKLLDTTYYGLCIAFHAYAAKLCASEGVEFDIVMKEANSSYNNGYYELDRMDVIRPVLYSPENGKIGGHCVIPNAEILRETMGEDPILQAILRHK